MLVVEPERRLSISQILAHSWMSEDGVIELEPGGYVIWYELYIVIYINNINNNFQNESNNLNIITLKIWLTIELWLESCLTI